MTDDEKIAFIKIRVGDVPSNPMYPMFADEDYQLVLSAVKGDINKATVMMAISAAMQAATWSSREVIDDFQIQNEFASSYLKALDYLIKNPASALPDGLAPVLIGEDKRQLKLMDVADLSCCGQLKCNPHSRHFGNCDVPKHCGCGPDKPACGC